MSPLHSRGQAPSRGPSDRERGAHSPRRKEAGRRSRAARGGLEAGAAALNRSAAGAVQSRAALGFGTMTVVLYWMSISHPSQVARKMLALKGVEYELVNVIPLNQ